MEVVSGLTGAQAAGRIFPAGGLGPSEPRDRGSRLSAVPESSHTWFSLVTT